MNKFSLDTETKTYWEAVHQKENTNRKMLYFPCLYLEYIKWTFLVFYHIRQILLNKIIKAANYLYSKTCLSLLHFCDKTTPFDTLFFANRNLLENNIMRSWLNTIFFKCIFILIMGTVHLWPGRKGTLGCLLHCRSQKFYYKVFLFVGLTTLWTFIQYCLVVSLSCVYQYSNH